MALGPPKLETLQSRADAYVKGGRTARRWQKRFDWSMVELKRQRRAYMEHKNMCRLMGYKPADESGRERSWFLGYHQSISR